MKFAKVEVSNPWQKESVYLPETDFEIPKKNIWKSSCCRVSRRFQVILIASLVVLGGIITCMCYLLIKPSRQTIPFLNESSSINVCAGAQNTTDLWIYELLYTPTSKRLFVVCSNQHSENNIATKIRLVEVKFQKQSPIFSNSTEVVTLFNTTDENITIISMPFETSTETFFYIGHKSGLVEEFASSKNTRQPVIEATNTTNSLLGMLKVWKSNNALYFLTETSNVVTLKSTFDLWKQDTQGSKASHINADFSKVQPTAILLNEDQSLFLAPSSTRPGDVILFNPLNNSESTVFSLSGNLPIKCGDNSINQLDGKSKLDMDAEYNSAGVSLSLNVGPKKTIFKTPGSQIICVCGVESPFYVTRLGQDEVLLVPQPSHNHLPDNESQLPLPPNNVMVEYNMSTGNILREFIPSQRGTSLLGAL
ncbi:hypothetical protein HK096_009446, partial [Nowakowskiella sp. JEL0078]